MTLRKPICKMKRCFEFQHYQHQQDIIFFMNAGFEWNVLMIKVIKASMRSCLGAFGLGKVAPKLKKRQWVYCYHTFDGSGNCIMFRIFLFTTQASTSFWKENCLLDSMASSLDVLGCLVLLRRILFAQKFSQVKYIEVYSFLEEGWKFHQNYDRNRPEVWISTYCVHYVVRRPVRPP